MSIRARITLFGVAVVAALLTCFASGVFALVSSSLPQSQDKQLNERAAAAVVELTSAPATAFTATSPLVPVDPSRSDDVFIVVYQTHDGDQRPDQDLEVLSRTGPVSTPVLPAAARPAGTSSKTATVVWDGVSVRVAVRAWQRPDLSRSGFVVAAQAVHRQQNDRRGLFVLLLVSVIITLIAAAVAIWLVVRRALRPLNELTAMADEVGRWPGLERRLPVTGRLDDLGRLAVSFNGMLDRLAHERRRTADALVAQQRFTADASHELRTPLTTIRSNSGFLRAHPEAANADRAAALADIESESERMSRLVEELLALARADGGGSLVFATHRLDDVVGQVIRQARTSHPSLTFHLVTDPVGGWIDRDAIVQVLWILIDNAARFATSTIWVRLQAAGSVARLSVADDGPGIAPPALHAVFGRFFRIPASDNGSSAGGSPSSGSSGTGAGLGLAIAHSIVTAHHGTISAANNARGGAIFTIDLPLAPSQVPGLEKA